jgi:beta-glucanase (GH16 family)
MRSLAPALFALALCACSSATVAEEPADAGPDASSPDASPRDAGADAGSDAGADAGTDAGAQDAGPDAGWTLLWHDEFDQASGSSPDATKWAFETGGGGWGNGELEYYTSRTDNAVISNGQLVITARREEYQGSHYTSARLKTQGKFAFTYGRAEMRAILPQGQGLWPAFWMLGTDITTAGWPQCGELDIMEFVGQTPSRIYGTIHGPAYNGAGGLGAWHELPGGFSSGFHVYAVEWEPGVVRWYLDDTLYEERTVVDLSGRTWVFNHDFFLLLNVAVGGAWPGSPDGTTVFPQTMTVDYVRVYGRPGGNWQPPRPRKVVSMLSKSVGQYVTADRYNSDLLSANRGSASTWELFELFELGGGQVALLSLAQDKFVTAGSAGTSPLSATVDTIAAVGPGETFTLVQNADGTSSLQSAASGKYVTVPVGGKSPLQATAPVIGSAEEFTLSQR